MSTIFYLLLNRLTISMLVGILICFIECTVSQTDVSSFGIFASSDSVSTTSLSSIRLLLSWNTQQWECMINETLSQSIQYYMCTTGDFEPNGTLITDSLSSNTYEMKIELLIEENINDLIRIETIRVIDDDVNYYDIDTFCLPPPFKYTAARGTSSERIECCYWSQRYSYNNYAMNADLKISYARFRSNVLNYPNYANEGAIKPPMITELGFTTLDIEGAGSFSNVSITLHWDSEEYLWSLQPNETSKTFIKMFSESNTFCEFSSGFSLAITALSNDTLGIDEIIIKDESGHYYNLNMFCPSVQIKEWQRYNNSEQQCYSDWSEYTMYHGFIYSGTTPIHLTWGKTVFLNADKKQQGLVLYDEYFSQYTCNSNDVPIVAPRAFTLFNDKMDDPVSTGWIFQGTYRESLNAPNCPGGINNKCSRLAGNGVSSSMQIAINVSNYDTLVDVSIQYDLALSSMQSGKSCYVQYAFDGSFSTGKTHTSSGATLQTLLDQSFVIPDHTDLKYNSITIKFLNNALYENEYCYIDNLYVFVGDTALEIDYCETFDSSWTYNGATIVSHTRCHRGACIYLDYVYDDEEWALKTYDIAGYNNLLLRADFKIEGYYQSIWYTRNCPVYYFYDNGPDALLGSVYGRQWNSYSNLIFTIPDSKICGASTLSVRFISNDGSDCAIDNVILLGNTLDTTSPTATPTQQTLNPSSDPTIDPTFHPTSNPTKTPTLQTITPSSNPTSVPTWNPTSNPTPNPTLYPTSNPTSNPTLYPTTYPTMFPTIFPSSNPTSYPTVYPTLYPSAYPTSNPTLYPTTYPATDPIFEPTAPANQSINPTTFPTKKPSDVSTKFPTKYPTNTENAIHSTLVTDSARNNAQNTSTSNSMKTVSIFFVVVTVLVLLLLIFVKLYTYTLHQNKANVEDIQEQIMKISRNYNCNYNDINIELEMAPRNQKGVTMGNATIDNGGKDIEDILERQKKIKIWFETHVKLNESNQKYYSLFMLNGYDQLSLIAEITNHDLIEMGIDKMGHRNRIIKAVQILTTDYI